MKMTKEHFNELKEKIEHRFSADTQGLLNPEKYESGDFTWNYPVKDLQKRYCFDVLYMSVPASWVCRELYPYLNDDHIFTALKAICPKVTKKY
jgi:hypothetical protein